MIGIEESQIEFVRFAQKWLQNYVEGTPRDVSVAMLSGDRRGGKSFAAISFVSACCIDAPVAADGTPLIAWIVCKSFREKFETEQWILHRLPEAWYRHLGAPIHEFHFMHGAILRLISADDDDATKQGRVDIAYINEPQKMGARAVAHAVGGSSDLGGLVVLAANPPPQGNSRGEWMFDLKDAIDDERVALAKGARIESLGVKYFHFESKKNRSIDQASRRRAGRIMSIIDPGLTAGDVEGEWRRPVDLAAWEFDKHRHLKPPPQLGMKDITAEVAGNECYGSWTVVGGVDFQNKPHIVSAIARVFGDPDDPTIHVIGEVIGERRQSEEQFLELFEDYGKPRGWNRQNFLWIGDASGDFQGAKHDFDGEERASFAVFRDDGWEIIPSQPPRPGSKTGRGKNPDVADRLQLTNEKLRRDRFFIDPIGAPWIAECVRKASTKRDAGKRKIVGNQWAHGFDAATYIIWRLSPRPNEIKFDPSDVSIVRLNRRG